MKKLKIVFLMAISLFFAGCAKSDIDVFRFVNHELEIQVGDEVVLNLIYGEYDENDEVLYTFSEEGIISLEGKTATGIGVGEVTVTATIDGIKTTKVIITVINEPIDSMQMTCPDTISVGATAQLTVSVLPDHLSNEVTWSIEDSDQSKASAATISASGLLTGVAGARTQAEYNAGGAKIIVVAQSIADPTMMVKKIVYVQYLPTVVLGLSTAGNVTIIAGGESVQLIASITPGRACPVVTYSSSDNTILLVSQTGLVTVPENSTKYETATITVHSLDGKTATYDLTVDNPND
jgi:alpha-amylase